MGSKNLHFKFAAGPRTTDMERKDKYFFKVFPDLGGEQPETERPRQKSRR